MAQHAALCLLASELSSGIVVDIGHARISAVPVYEGHAVWPAMRSVDYGVGDLRAAMVKQLQVLGSTTQRQSAAKQLLQRHCFVPVAGDEAQDVKEKSVDLVVEGAKLEVRVRGQVLRCPEALFTPRVVGQSHSSLPVLVMEALRCCEPWIRATVAAHVVLAGGGSRLLGLQARLAEELEARLLKQGLEASRVLARDKREHLSWSGGALLMQEEDSLWRDAVMRSEFRHYGVSAVQAKCV